MIRHANSYVGSEFFGVDNKEYYQENGILRHRPKIAPCFWYSVILPSAGAICQIRPLIRPRAEVLALGSRLPECLCYSAASVKGGISSFHGRSP